MVCISASRGLVLLRQSFIMGLVEFALRLTAALQNHTAACFKEERRGKIFDIFCAVFIKSPLV